MTFQGYINTIREKTGLGPADFIRLATEKGFNTAETKATPITDWLQAEYGLGHGHAMAIVKLLRDTRSGAPLPE